MKLVINKKYPYKHYNRFSDKTGRKYLVDNVKVPSVTTILGATKDMRQLNNWRRRVEVKDVYGYQPDFEIFSEIEVNEDGVPYGGSSICAKRYFIEVKPIKSQSEFYSDAYKSFRDKVHKSGILKESILFIVGNNLKLRTKAETPHADHIFVYAFRMLDEDENINDKNNRDHSLCSFSGCYEGNYEGIGLKESWNDCRNDWIKERQQKKIYYDVCELYL